MLTERSSPLPGSSLSNEKRYVLTDNDKTSVNLFERMADVIRTAINQRR